MERTFVITYVLNGQHGSITTSRLEDHLRILLDNRAEILKISA